MCIVMLVKESCIAVLLNTLQYTCVYVIRLSSGITSHVFLETQRQWEDFTFFFFSETNSSCIYMLFKIAQKVYLNNSVLGLKSTRTHSRVGHHKLCARRWLFYLIVMTVSSGSTDLIGCTVGCFAVCIIPLNRVMVV